MLMSAANGSRLSYRREALHQNTSKCRGSYAPRWSAATTHTSGRMSVRQKLSPEAVTVSDQALVIRRLRHFQNIMAYLHILLRVPLKNRRPPLSCLMILDS